MNCFEKTMFILIDFPFCFLRDLTVPSCELKNWNRLFFTLFPITSVLFLLFITGNLSVIALNWYVSLGVFLGLVVICVILNLITYRNRLPSQVLVISYLIFRF